MAHATGSQALEHRDGLMVAKGAEGLSPEELFREYYRSCCRFVYLVLGDSGDAEDVVMEVFGRVLGGRTRAQVVNAPYLHKAVINEARSLLRRRRTLARILPRLHRETNVTDRIPPIEEADRVLGALRKLPVGQRAAVSLRYYGGFSDREIAERLGCSVGSVKSQLHKARAKLVREFSLDDSDDNFPKR